MTDTAEPAIELRGLNKSFWTPNGPIVANADINLKVAPGSIHALIGENGAGKSTAMKMVYGLYRPDAGEIYIHSRRRQWSSPSEAIAAGIGMVHQHFMLAGPYDALENVIAGSETLRDGFWRWVPSWFRPLARKSALARLEELSNQYGLKVDWNSKVEDLPVGVQQRIEILKLLYREANILILDEPTAVLTPQEVQDFFQNLRKLRDQGKTILIITHKLKEVMSLSDYVTVFRAGRVVADVKTSETTVEELASKMVGRKVTLQAEAPAKSSPGKAVLSVEHLSYRPAQESPGHALFDLSFEVREGEIVGIAGVEGNGQSDILQILLHPDEFGEQCQGAIRYFGQEAMGKRKLSLSEIKAMGIGVIPEDRHKEGLLLDRSLRENFLLGHQRRREFQRRGWIMTSQLEKRAALALENYDVRPRAMNSEARGLSGGNQQKLIVAREFETSPKFLIAAQPTRGVDIGAIEAIHERILSARAAGTGVLLVSSELDEILALSDRILVLYDGRIVAEFKRGEVNEQQLGLCMGGAAR